MPTYDYLCRSCGHQMELFQSMTESPRRKCPACGDLKLKRLIGTGAGVVFKGSGFYQTDYRSKSYKEGVKADQKERGEGKPAGGSKGPSHGKASGGKASDGKASGGKASGGDPPGGGKRAGGGQDAAS